MTYDEISPPMRKFIGGFQAFRKLGFSADDLFLMVANSARNQGLLSCFVSLRTQGKEFLLEICPIEDGEELGAEYRRIAAAADKVPEADLQRMWEESEPYSCKSAFILAIMKKGIRLPLSSN